MVIKDGKLYGHNTDGIGFVKNLKEHGVDVKDKVMTVMGAGGAATAIQVQSALEGAREIHIFNRRDEFMQMQKIQQRKLKSAFPV